MHEFSVIREINEIKNQLAHARNIGFFLGAGTSCALKLPNIDQLTALVETKLESNDKECFNRIIKEIESSNNGVKTNIENVLSLIRLIREITNEQDCKEYLQINGQCACELDDKICKAIYDIISEKENEANLSVVAKFFSWFDLLSRDFTKEIFTTNYDLIFEKSLESRRIPYFDGFVGAYEPFFFQESIEEMSAKEIPPISWIRLWKLHGSLNWYWKKDSLTNSNQIIRTGKTGLKQDTGDELVIYPSREKYDMSRRQPFIAYFDRLRNFLQCGELLFLINGFSFSDQHVNEVIFNGLRENNRLFGIAFCYQDEEVVKLKTRCETQLNFNVIGPTKSIINGNYGNWKNDAPDDYDSTSFWDTDNNKFILGDFEKLVNFLVLCSGKSDQSELSK